MRPLTTSGFSDRIQQRSVSTSSNSSKDEKFLRYPIMARAAASADQNIETDRSQIATIVNAEIVDAAG